MTLPPLLDIKDLRVSFPTHTGTTEVVCGVDFTMQRERLGVIGAVGSGKSQVGLAILGLTPDHGRVTARCMLFDDIDLLCVGEQRMRMLRGSRISMIVQDPKHAFDPVMIIGKQIMETCLAHFDISRAEAYDRSLFMLSKVKFSNPRRIFSSYPHELSLGMCQRALIAMMLISEPDLLIADEATSALDMNMRRDIIRIFDDLVTNHGLGLLFISHDPWSVSALCQRSLVMSAGKIVDELDTSRLLKYPHTCIFSSHSSGMKVSHLSSGTAIRPVKEIIGVEDLTVVRRQGRQDISILHHVGLSVSEGEAFALVGETGCGKSTLLRAICGLSPTISGTIRIAGKVLGSTRDATFCKRVQMVFQDTRGSLHPHHTVYRTLSEPLMVHRFAERQERVVQVMEEVGLDISLRFRYPHQLSGGQRQLISIARALIMEPCILLLDEPTASIDAVSQQRIIALLNRLRGQRCLTFLLVSHDLSLVYSTCDRFSLVRDGEITPAKSCDLLSGSLLS